jgi:L-fuculose-phosphate aldolase
MNEAALRAEIVRVCRALYDRGLIAGREGNVSARLGDDRLLVTPAGFAKGMLDPRDIAVVTTGGEKVGGAERPSTEIGMHLRIYARRPDVQAIVHAHPPHATAFAAAGRDFMTPVFPELIAVTGPVPLVPYARSGEAALGDAIEPFLPGHDVFLLANHGATATGDSLAEAHARMESLEQGAHILTIASGLGRPALPAGEGDHLLAEWRRARLARLTSKQAHPGEA